MGYNFQFLADRLNLFQLGGHIMPTTLLRALHPAFLDLKTALWCFPKTVLTDQTVKLENWPDDTRRNRSPIELLNY